MEAIGWIKSGVASGAGEIVLNSIDTDGVKGGFDLEMLEAVCDAVSVPVIASGGAGSIDDFVTLFKALPKVDAGLAASIFHFGEVSIPDLKAALARTGSRRDPGKEDEAMLNIDELKFDEKGLIPAIVVDAISKRVLTLAYMNRESLQISMEKELTCFWSRSRQELWLKGETSGNVQHLVSVTADCDRDALVVEVEQGRARLPPGHGELLLSSPFGRARPARVFRSRADGAAAGPEGQPEGGLLHLLSL